MTCARARAALSRYLDDELTARQRSELLAHLAGCPDCTARLARFRQQEVLLKKLPDSQPSGEVRAAIMLAARRQRRGRGVRAHAGWWLSLGGRVNPRLTVGGGGLGLTLALGLLFAQLAPALPQAFGFVPTVTPTSSYLDVPASPTPPSGSASAPRLVSTTPFDGAHEVDIHGPLLVRFDQAMDRRSVERAFRLDPPAPGAFAWEADNELHFSPGVGGLLRGVTYTVALAEGAHGLGGAVLPPGPLWSFVTRDPPRLLSNSPASDSTITVPTATLVLTFSQAMEPAGVEHALGLTGSTGPGGNWHLGGSGAWSADGRVLAWTPAAPLPVGRVQVVLGVGGHSADGGALAPARWEFTVAAREATITLAGPRLLAVAGGSSPPTIAYQAVAGDSERPLSRVTFSLTALPPDRLRALLPVLLADRSVPATAPWPSNAGNGLPVAHTWTASPSHAPGLTPDSSPDLTTLPVREPGVYLLTADAPGATGDARVVVLGGAGLAVLATGDSWLVWNADGGPAQVRLFAADGVVVSEGTSDANGLYRATPPPGSKPVLAWAERGGSPAFARLDSSPGQSLPLGPRLAATIRLDRPAYAPGDALLFSAVVPATAAGGVQAGASVGVLLHDGAGRVLGALLLKPDGNGAVAGSFALAPALAPAHYTLDLMLDGATARQDVPVVARPSAPPPLLRLSLPGDALFAGDRITPTLSLLDPSGAPIVAAAITWTVSGGTDGELPPAFATTDATGSAALPLRLPLPSSPDTVLVLHASASSPTGATATLAAPLPPVRGRMVLDLALNALTFSPDSRVIATATLRDVTGAAVVGQPVILSLAIPGGVGGETSPLLTTTTPSNGAGQVGATLPLPLQGQFVVRAVTTDSLGVATSAATRIWVYGEGSSAAWAVPPLQAADLLLTPDHPAYAPGITARLLAQPGAPGPALLVSTLDGVVTGQQVVSLPANGTVLTVSIPASARDGALFTLTILRPIPGNLSPHIAPTRLTLPIAAPALHLRADLLLDHADGQYAPGSTVSATLLLHDGSGAPVSGHAILALRPAEVPEDADPTSSAEAILQGSMWPTIDSTPDATGNTAPADPNRLSPAAYWNPGLPTDTTGSAHVNLTLPATGGAWRLVAWTFAPGGAATRVEVAIHAPPVLDLIWNPPATLVVGDGLRLVATVRNMTGAPLSTDVRLRAEGGGLSLGSPGLLPLTLGAGESRRLEWLVDAGGAGTPQLVLEAGWGGTDSVAAGVLRYSAAISVAPYGLPSDQYSAGTTNGDDTLTLILPGDAPPAAATLLVQADAAPVGLLAASLSAQLAEGAGQGALVAAAARLSAGASLSRLVRRAGLPADTLPDPLAAARLLDLQYVMTAQNADGSWGVAPATPGDTGTTGAVLSSLVDLADEREAGGLADTLPLDNPTITRAVAWLQTALLPGPDVAAPAVDPQLLYVLSRYHAANREVARRQLAGAAGLSPAARAWLALALDRLDAHDEALTLLLTPAASSAPPGDSKPSAPSALTSAVLLHALLTINSEADDAQVDRLATTLLAARQGAGWGDPASTAAATGALADWAARTPATGAAVKLRVLVNGVPLQEATLSSRTPGSGLRLQVPAASLRPGPNTVRLVTDGPTPIYYSLTLHALRATAARPLPAAHAPGFLASLQREVSPTSAAGWTTGAPVAVTLTLTLSTPVIGFALRDPLAAALGPDGPARLERVDTPAVSVVPPALVSATGDLPQTFVLGPLPAGTYRLRYPARLTQAGTFTLLPATGAAPAADNTAAWVQSDGRTITIEDVRDHK